MSRVARDERGAMMVLGAFMAIFLVGLLYYLIGLGDAVWQRERMQDAADAAAFSAAALHARGMNLIVLINMAMAALLAVLIALKLIEAVVTAALVAAIFLCVFTGGGACALVPALKLVASKAKAAHAELQPPVHSALRVLRLSARGVRVAVPWMAQARVADLVNQAYAPPAVLGIVVPSRIALPTRDDTFGNLCTKAGEYVGDLVALPFSALPLPDVVADAIGDATAGLIASGPDYFCGTGEAGEAPSVTRTVKVRHPELPSVAACREHEAAQGEDQVEHEEVCATAERETEEAMPDPDTGHCRQACDSDGPYMRAAKLARTACAPKEHDDRLGNFHWQSRTFERVYVFESGAWRTESTREAEERSARYALHKTDGRPCGARSRFAPDRPWRAELRAEPDGPIAPICGNEAAPSEPAFEGARVTLTHTQAWHVFGCTEKREQKIVVDAEPGALEPSDGQADALAPQRLEEGAVLGEEPFQLRSVVLGGLPDSSLERFLSILKSSQAAGAVEWRVAQQLGRLAIAQAELYYAVGDGNADPASFMWSMRWRARLRRFRFPSNHEIATTEEDHADGADASLFGVGTTATTIDGACRTAVASSQEKGAVSPCDPLRQLWDDAIVH